MNAANQLINETSAYLLQHAYNPVQWQGWTAEALAQAVKEDKPIMLSIGYAACHWCHVMEHESFEDEQVAKILNENFIAIKVDREERPDLDEIYMTAVQLMTGHGGWPLTVFLTPDGQPFFGGTYFPKENRQYGQQVVPGFKTILNAVIRSWADQRQEIKGSAQNITDAISDLNDQITKDVGQAQTEQPALEAGLHLLSLFDKEWGGFGKAPKFPQVLCLSLCLRLAFKLKQLDDKRHELFLEALSTSLDCMARGGMYDHLGGGFARYSTDRKWHVPHFEKMLYDNALLSQLYLDAYSFTGNKHWLEIGCETLDFIERESYSQDGGFYSSLDADSEGKEGKFYVWTKAEINEILGTDADWFCQEYSVTDEGNFEAGENILYQKANANTEKDTKQLKEKLFAHRAKRIRPGTDDKILTSWNGLTITAFVTGYRVTGEEKYLEIAKKAGSFILNHLYREGRLSHVYAGGKSKISGYLEDYAFFVQALLDLCGIDENPIWLNAALTLTEATLQHFYDAVQGDFFYTADDQEKLISRTKNNADGPIPSSTSVAVQKKA